MKNKCILITGACGYVGTQLTNHLLEQGHTIIGVDTMWFGNYLDEHPRLTLIQADVRDIEKVPMRAVDVVIHLANIANDPAGDLNSKLTWEVNVLASKLLVEKAIEHKVSQLIFASSGSVYGVKEEEQVTEELSLVPISDYNKTKMISERVFMSYKDDICIQMVRPATICGYSKRMRLDLSVNMLTMQALKNKKITVFGGKQTRPNIHIRDMLGVYQHFLEKGDSLAGVYNAGFENISILDIANKITETVPSDVVVTESDDPRSYRLSSEKLLKTGYQQKFGIADGITEVKEAFETGLLDDSEEYYTIKTMVKLGLGG